MSVTSYRGYKYNGAIDSIDVREGVIFEVGDGQGEMFVNDIFGPIPRRFYEADYLFIDPPWNLGNIKTFYLKADIEYKQGDFSNFIGRVFGVIRELHDKGSLRAAFIEMGKQAVGVFAREAEAIFGNVRVYESKYYNKNLCYIIQAWDDGYFTDIPDEAKDELKMIDDLIRLNPGRHVLDFCGGRGAVSRTAFKYGQRFTLTELNKNRLAVAIQDIIKKGGAVNQRAV